MGDLTIPAGGTGTLLPNPSESVGDAAGRAIYSLDRAHEAEGEAARTEVYAIFHPIDERIAAARRLAEASDPSGAHGGGTHPLAPRAPIDWSAYERETPSMPVDVSISTTGDANMATGGAGDSDVPPVREETLTINGHVYSISDEPREGYVPVHLAGVPEFWARSEDRDEIIAAHLRSDGAVGIGVTYERPADAADEIAPASSLGEPVMFDWSGRPVYESPSGDVYEDGTPYVSESRGTSADYRDRSYRIGSETFAVATTSGRVPPHEGWVLIGIVRSQSMWASPEVAPELLRALSNEGNYDVALL